MTPLLSQLETALAPGGRIVFLHHVRPFNDAAQPPAIAQARFRARFNAMQLVFQKRDRGSPAAGLRAIFIYELDVGLAGAAAARGLLSL
jgi:hypothetical protein